ncbi:DUF3576 domain-containing protein [Leisingera sp. M527]|uniref:DUF3576 domain-containing protein n=1 Tax=Leisingera sp. M527 TaxID=2867014 RepID=UPI0021A8F3D0|nr:DUF3576 domain-containing protein [Leisingera sp. M527]UWQ32662.1 DUF3576 domain-containing protein [Leisingera sp. M527]
MKYGKTLRVTLIGAICLGVAACGDGNKGGKPPASTARTISHKEEIQGAATQSSIWDVFRGEPDQNVQVNRYLWAASLDVLNFLPVQSVDPFTGVIITGYGTPPGGGRTYRATVHIKDPALDARSLNVALQSKGGPVSASTSRAVEDAILSRARQLRIADKKL